MIRTIILVGTASALSSYEASAQDTFCAVLKSVTAAASSGKNLDSLKSKQTAPRRWSSNRDVPGFKDCYITEVMSPLYQCQLELNSPKTAKAKAHELEEAIRACLPDFKREVSVVWEAPSLMVSYYHNVSPKHSVTVRIDYLADSHDRFVSLHVNQLIND